MEAIRLFRECLAARQRTLGASHPDTATSTNNIAVCLMQDGEYSEAIPLLRELVEFSGVASPDTEWIIRCGNLANCLAMAGQLDEADRVLREGLERAAPRLGPDHQWTDAFHWLQIRVWIVQGHVEKAVALGLEALGVRRRVYPAGHPLIAAALMDFGHGLVRMKRFDETEAALSESVSIFAGSPVRWLRISQLGLSAGTEPAWWAGGGLQRPSRTSRPPKRGCGEARTTPRRYYREGVVQLVKLYEAWGKSDQAARWRAQLTALGDSAGPSVGKGGSTSGSRN